MIVVGGIGGGDVHQDPLTAGGIGWPDHRTGGKGWRMPAAGQRLSWQVTGDTDQRLWRRMAAAAACRGCQARLLGGTVLLLHAGGLNGTEQRRRGWLPGGRGWRPGWRRGRAGRGWRTWCWRRSARPRIYPATDGCSSAFSSAEKKLNLINNFLLIINCTYIESYMYEQ